jgi:tetratricopeptide (TPR) repeat protein
MNGYWAILGIEPTDDLSVIKKAYSKQLKVHHPEDDPEGYQRLREAFDRAKRDLKRRERVPAHAETAVVVGASRPEPSLTYYNQEQKRLTPVILPDVESLKSIETFMEKVESLYSDITARISEEAWLKLLDDELLWSIEHKQEVSEEILYFISEHHLLPKKIWLLLENQFQWYEMMKEDLDDLDTETKERFFPYYKKRIEPSVDLSFEFAASVQGIHHDEFFQARERAFDAFFEGDMISAENEAVAAAEIFTGDPDLLLIQGLLATDQQSYDEAEIFLSKAYSLRPVHQQTIFHLAKIFLLRKDFDKAAHLLLQHQDTKDTKFLLATVYVKSDQYEKAETLLSAMISSWPDDTDVISLLGHVFFKQERLIEAREQFTWIRELEPYDAEAITMLAEINRLLHTRKIRKKLKHRIPKSHLKKEMNYYSLKKKMLIFFLSQLRWRLLIPLVLAYFSYNKVSEIDEKTNPFWLMFMFILNLFISTDQDFYDFIFWPAIWSIVFLVSVSFIWREWKKITRGLR